MSEDAEFKRAFFTPQSGAMKGEKIDVHFNPASLQYTITNTLENKGKGNDKKQFVSQSTGKLTMDLIFDTTHDGQDVHTHTQKIGNFMKPDEKKIPPIVQFEWGTYKFQGMVESYKETIDFFAPNGVPLRATINLSLANQDKVFEPGDTSSKFDTQGALQPEPVEVPSGAGGGAASTAARAGDSRAGRAIAAANYQESLRFSSGPSLTVSGSVQLGGPVAFATGGAGVGLGIGASVALKVGIDTGAGIEIGAGGGVGGGIGISAGAGLEAGAGLSVSGGVEAGLSVGGSASAGVSATAGAFAGLRASARGRRPSSRLDPDRLIQRSASVSLASDSGARFRVGGQASIEGSTSLSADVGASASLRSHIEFEEG